MGEDEDERDVRVQWIKTTFRDQTGPKDNLGLHIFRAYRVACDAGVSY